MWYCAESDVYSCFRFLQRDPNRGSSRGRDCRVTQRDMVLRVTRNDDDVEALSAQEEFSVEDGERDVILSVRTNGEPDE